ncbi:MAG TPA: hypothetical protein VG676_14625 [Chitinophagaceae bacterium]|jgi:hypothetical protein|nr:hypothetical protein [Chitinophagaceae bacterium]
MDTISGAWNLLRLITLQYLPSENNPNTYKALALMGLSGSSFYSEVAETIGEGPAIDELRRPFAGVGTENCSN